MVIANFTKIGVFFTVLFKREAHNTCTISVNSHSLRASSSHASNDLLQQQPTAVKVKCFIYLFIEKQKGQKATYIAVRLCLKQVWNSEQQRRLLLGGK